MSLRGHPGEEEQVAVAMMSPGAQHGGDKDEAVALAAVAATASPGGHPGEEEEVTIAATSPRCHPSEEQEEEEVAVTAAVTSLRCHPSEEQEEVTAAEATLAPDRRHSRDEDMEAVAVVTSPECHPSEEQEEMTAAVTSSECPPVGAEEEVTAGVTSLGRHPSEEEEVTAAVTSPGCSPAGEEEEEETQAMTSPGCVPVGDEEEEVTAAVTAAAATSALGGRRGADEDVAAAGWRARRKHVFVLSEAGKPIYSRHGNEEALAATMGVMMALVSFIQSGGNAIRAICSGTARGDTGRAGHGTPQTHTDPPRVPLKQPHTVAVLAAHGRLVTAARQRALAEGGRLCASDLHLLLNLLGGGAGAGEVWTPVCLPRFNPDGYFYAYAARLGEEEEEGVTLILLSTEREGFYAAAACRRQLEDTLRAQGWLAELGAAVQGGAGYGPSRAGAPELRHFLYKPLEGPEEMQQLPQFTSPELEEPYTSEEEQHRLFDLYHYLHSRVHSPQRPLRLLYHVAEKETLLAWVTSKFELYSCFSPLVTKAGAIAVLTKLLRWLKKEEDWLFIRYPAPFSAAPARPEGAEPEG
ncbi:vacuolar fusion protein MON1 homolog B-like [Corapipo altera]|uniref:vacuolar fusion protein MON1 homolog B-like n=1 Tax=Corapipo altera TaxID=415028 RepID=UPI000FD65638|nr:vacuolar fusion protein MON1 homolog B-like [Corapipo altera]